MEMSLIEKVNPVRTRFKLTLNEFKQLKPLLEKIGIDTQMPVKRSSRYIYFEKEGDLLNNRK